MNDKIKEILDNLKYTAKKHTMQVLENGGKIERCPQEITTEMRLNTYSANILLDYITDLQARNEKAIEILEQDKASASFNTAERIALNLLQGEDNTPENLYKYTPEKGFRLVGDEDVKD